MTRILPIILLSFVFLACSKQEEEPKQFSSYDFRMDGSWHVPDIGVPSTVGSLTVGNSVALFTAPIPVINAGNFTYAISSSGNSIALGNETTSKIITSFPGSKAILELLTDNSKIYAIHIDGKIHTIDHEGKTIWQADLSGVATSHSIFAENTLIGASYSGITSIDLNTGKVLWSYETKIAPCRSLIYDSKAKCIIALLSDYGVEDSIICYTPSGEVKSRTGFADVRIVSNLCLCGKEKNLLALGYLKEASVSHSERTMHIGIFSGVEDGHVKNTSDHELPYFATKISSNGPIVLSAGFYNSAASLESGIDAFYADDTTKLWQRRFTYPVAAPVAVSSKNAYFTLTYSTEALVPARSIFYTLDLSTGKTLSELPIVATNDAVVTGIPMPMNDKGFMLSSPGVPVIYFLKP